MGDGARVLLSYSYCYGIADTVVCFCRYGSRWASGIADTAWRLLCRCAVTIAVSLEICRDSCIHAHTPTLGLPLQIPEMPSHLLYMLSLSLSLCLDRR